MNEDNEIITLEDLYCFLKKFSLSDSLYVIAMINNIFKYGFNKLHLDKAPRPLVEWTQNQIKSSNSAAALMIQITRLSRFLLLSGANDYRKVSLDIDKDYFYKALELVSLLFDEDIEGKIETKYDVARIFGRMGQWQFPLQSNRGTIIGRANLLFVEIPSQVTVDYCFDDKMKEYFDINIAEFILSGVALWIMSNGVLKYNLNVEVESLKDIVNKNNINKFIKLSSGTVEDYKKMVRGDNWKQTNKLLDVYGLDPFLSIPIIKINKSKVLDNDSYIVPQPFYLLTRSSVGIFYLLADRERETSESLNKLGKNNFRESFGHIYKEYVGRHLNQKNSQIVFIDLDVELPINNKKPDFAIIKDDNCLLFEVKTALLNVNNRTIFDPVKSRDEMINGNIKKAFSQLQSFESLIKNNLINDVRFKNIKNVVKVIVGFEDVYLANAFLLPIASEIFGLDSKNLQFGSISDIESIGSLSSSDTDPVSLLHEKVNNQETAEWSIDGFIKNKYDSSLKNQLLEDSFSSFMMRAMGDDYRRDTKVF